MGSARWGVFDHENWSVALDTSYFFFPSDFQKPTQRFKANECVTPFEKDPPAQPENSANSSFWNILCLVAFFLLQRSKKKEKYASLHLRKKCTMKKTGGSRMRLASRLFQRFGCSVKRRPKAPAGEVTSTSTEEMEKLVGASVGCLFSKRKCHGTNTNPNPELGRSKEAQQKQ